MQIMLDERFNSVFVSILYIFFQLIFTESEEKKACGLGRQASLGSSIQSKFSKEIII